MALFIPPHYNQITINLLFLLFAVTGSCFFIFSSALKASAGHLAKSSIVEGTISTYKGDPIDFHILPAGRKIIVYVWGKLKSIIPV